MYKCKKCNFVSESVSNLANHYKHIHKSDNIFVCNVCNKKLKSKSGLSCHIKFCKGHPNLPKSKFLCPKCNFEIKANFDKHFNYCNGKGPRRQRPKLGHAWSKGLTKETDERIKRISETLKNRIHPTEGPKHTEETKMKLSILMNERYKSGWESTAGRCKKIRYVSKIAGEIKVDGNWELNVAVYLDKIGVTWCRNKKRFKYFNANKNKYSTYCPDFFVSDWNCYIEVKGYITELDKIKWSQFSDNLEIWDKNKLIYLGIDVKYRRNKGK